MWPRTHSSGVAREARNENVDIKDKPESVNRMLGSRALKVSPQESLLQSRPPEHFLKLTARPHINRLRYQFSLAIVDEALWNSFHHESFMHLAPGIKQHRIRDLALC